MIIKGKIKNKQKKVTKLSNNASTRIHVKSSKNVNKNSIDGENKEKLKQLKELKLQNVKSQLPNSKKKETNVNEKQILETKNVNKVKKRDEMVTKKPALKRKNFTLEADEQSEVPSKKMKRNKNVNIVKKRDETVTKKPTLKRKNITLEADEQSEVPRKKMKRNKNVKLPEVNKVKTEKSIKQNDEAVIERTLFVGNIPVDTKRKTIKKVFSIYGNILTLRFRGAIPADLKMSKKVAAMTNKLNSNVKNMNCFIVFSSKDEVTKALVANGMEFKGNRLRVDRAKPDNVYNPKHSVFLGNLPYDAQENDLWNAFQECGNIVCVRLIRDNRTGVGKGFGYINFDNPDSVELALQLDFTIGKRNVRVERIGSGRQKKTPEGKKVRKIPRLKNSNDESKTENQETKKKSSQGTDFHGAKFKTKKKTKKVNKGELQKKKFTKMLTKNKPKTSEMSE